MTVRSCTLSAVFWDFLCELDLLGIRAGAVEVSIEEEGVNMISDNVADLTQDESKTGVNSLCLISKVDPSINGNLS